MKYLSVCSGIEAASAAWHHLGWTPLAFSEIEPFPRAVLAHHFPDVPLHGDFTVLRDQPWIVDADLLVGGTPCQAFSVAGLRGSLADARGNLTLEFVRLANAIDDFRRAAGRAPSWVLWENVPGVLSVADNAFGSFLGGLVGSDAAIEPPPGRGWTDAGVVHGPRRCAAWRVLDAQHFGVAQRRRRVFVLARGGAGGWAAADALLPVIDSVSWHPAPRREAREGSAAGAARGARSGGGLGTDAELDGALIPEIANPLTARMHKGVNTTADEGQTMIAHSLRGEGFDASEDGTGRGTPLVPVAFQQTADCLTAAYARNWNGNASATNGSLFAGQANGGGQVAVAFPIISDADRADSSAQTPSPDAEGRVRLRDPGLGVGAAGDPMFTLQSTKPHAVAFDTTQITSPSNYSRPQPGDPCHPLATGAHAPTIAWTGDNITADPISASEAKTYTHEGGVFRMHNVMQTSMQVRRLTPRECERLQGFPDNWTAIPWRGKPAAECPDGPRYKALGNSMAVPCMRWLGERIAEVST